MKRNWKIVTSWILGSICILAGSMISGNLEKNVGTTDFAYYIALIISLILFLFAGLLWISVSVAIKKISEE